MILTRVTVIQLVDKIIQIIVEVIVRLRNVSIVSTIERATQTHVILCGVYSGEFSTYINLVWEWHGGFWIVIFEGVEVKNPPYSIKNVLSEGLVEWERPPTSQHIGWW
jgi:hypothetical protein